MIEYDMLERWPSGRRRTIGNRVWGKLHRGFESLPLRHLNCKIQQIYQKYKPLVFFYPFIDTSKNVLVLYYVCLTR